MELPDPLAHRLWHRHPGVRSGVVAPPSSAYLRRHTGSDLDATGGHRRLFGCGWHVRRAGAASRQWGSGDWRRDYAVAIDWRRDLPIAWRRARRQLVLVPVIVGLFKLIDSDLELSEASVDLAERTKGAGFVLLAVLVAVMAPVIEEIFFRGLLQRSLARHLPQVPGVGIAGALFGVSHFSGGSASGARCCSTRNRRST